MSSTLDEDVERLLRLIVNDLQKEPASKKDRLPQIHRVRHMIDQITTTIHKLVELREGKDNARKDEDEIAGLGGQSATGTNVLRALSDRLKEVTAEFEEQRAYGKVDGWKDEAQENGYVSDQNTSIDVDYYSTVDELVEALGALGQNGAVATQHQNDDSEQIALLGVKIEKLCEIMSEKIMRAKENVEKKQAQIYEEIDAEREDEEVPDIDSDDEDQEIYNPLKLPMGSDGKPMPYWLYKLRALGQEFKCEICGNYSYWGRRAYERHFKEFQHQCGTFCGFVNHTADYKICFDAAVLELFFLEPIPFSHHTYLVVSSIVSYGSYTCLDC